MKKYLLIAGLVVMTVNVFGIPNMSRVQLQPIDEKLKNQKRLVVTAKLPLDVDGVIDRMRGMLSQGVEITEVDGDTALSAVVKKVEINGDQAQSNVTNKKAAERLQLLFKYWGVEHNKGLNFLRKNKKLKQWYEKECQSFLGECNKLRKTIQDKNATREKVEAVLRDWGEVNSFVDDMPLLIYAIEQNNIYAVEWLLSQENINVNIKYYKNKQGRERDKYTTPLGVAIKNGYELMVRRLLDNPNIDIHFVENINLRFVERMSVNMEAALKCAAQNQQFRIMEILLNHGTNTYTNEEKSNALICALFVRNYKIASLLIRYNRYKEDDVWAEIKNVKFVPMSKQAMMNMLNIIFHNSELSQDKKYQVLLNMVQMQDVRAVEELLSLNNYSDHDLFMAWSMSVDKSVDAEKRICGILIENEESRDKKRKEWARQAITQLNLWDRREFIKNLLNLKDENGEKLIDINNFLGENEGFLMFLMLENNREPVQKAFGKDYNGFIKRLIGYGYSLNQVNSQGYSDLFVALGFNYPEFAEAILNQKGVDVATVDEYNQTPLIMAEHKCYRKIAKRILKLVPNNKKKDYINIKSSIGGYSALFAAIQSNDEEMVQLLIDAGADVNILDHNNSTPLMKAASHGWTGIVKLLLQKGADISIKNNQGETALDIVQNMEYREEIVQLLKEKEKSENQEFDEELKSPIEQFGLSAEEVNERFISAFNKKYADREEFLGEEDFVDEMNQMLLQRDKNGAMLVSEESINDAFLNSVKEGDIEVFDLLFPYLKDLNVRDSNGNTALILSVEAGHDMFVSMLLEKGGMININAENNKGKTALMVAVDKKYTNMIKELQNYGAKISDSKGKSDKTYGREAIKTLIKEETSDHLNNMILSPGSFSVYAGNAFCKQLSELEGDSAMKYLAKKARRIIQRLSKNPNYRSEEDENPEAWNFGCYSRRLNDEHRFIYRVIRGVVQCLFCKEHNTKLERSDKKDIDNRSCKYKWGLDEKGEYDFILLDHEDRGTLNDIAGNQTLQSTQVRKNNQLNKKKSLKKFQSKKKDKTKNTRK